MVVQKHSHNAQTLNTLKELSLSHTQRIVTENNSHYSNLRHCTNLENPSIYSLLIWLLHEF